MLEPEVRIAGYRRIGKKEILVLLSEPLEPGRKYTLRAASGAGLSGKVELSVRPLEVAYDPLPYIGPQGRPAILFTANGPISSTAQERLLKTLPADLQPEWLPLSTPERGLMLLSKAAQGVSFASYKDAALRIAGGQVDLPAKVELPFEVREAALEAVEGRYGVRLTCSHDPSAYAAHLTYYLRIGPRAIAYTAEVQGVDVVLNLQEVPTEPVQVEVTAGLPRRRSKGT